MILYIELPDKKCFSYRINSFDDLRPVLQQFHGAAYALLHASSLEDAVDKVAQYISRHHITAWIEGDNLNKGVKDMVFKLGMATQIAATPALSSQPYMVSDPSQKSISSVLPFGKHPADAFLWTIKQLESSGGKNVMHAAITNEYPAIGRFGMKYTTIQDTFRRSKALRRALGPIQHVDYHTMRAILLNHPEIELTIARHLAEYILNNHQSNYKTSAYAWRYGSNLKNNSTTQNLAERSPYVKEFQRIHLDNPFREPLTKQQVLPSFIDKLYQWFRMRNDIKWNEFQVPLRNKKLIEQLANKQLQQCNDESLPKDRLNINLILQKIKNAIWRRSV